MSYLVETNCWSGFAVNHQTMQSICSLQIQHKRTTNLKTTELMAVSESSFVCESNSLKAQYAIAIFKLKGCSAFILRKKKMY